MINKVGEVIETSTDRFTAQCYELHRPPPFGSFLSTKEGDIDIFAVVSGAATGSIEPGRRPVARGRGEVEEDDVYRSSPQLEKLLRTDIDAVVVGHRDGERVAHFLPPRPAKVHSFVHVCEPGEVAAFTQSLDFLNILIDVRQQADELIAATLRGAAAAHPDPHAFLVKAGKELAMLLTNEPNRLNAILRRIKI